MSKRDRDAEGRPTYAGARDQYGRPRPRGSADALRQRVHPPNEVEEAIRLGADLFDQHRFFEAHELFEHVWKSDEIAGGETRFWKAVTQVCVGFCHVQRGNSDGARSVLARAARVLESDRRVLRNVDGTALAVGARAVYSLLAAHAEADEVQFPRFPRGGQAARKRPKAGERQR